MNSLQAILDFISGTSTDSSVTRTAFWTFVIAFFTLGIWWTAWRQLKKLNKTTSAEFLVGKLKEHFFTAENRKFYELIDNKLLQFVDTGHFINCKNNELISTYEIDDFLLGHFEEIGLLEQRGIIDIEMVYEFFGYYIETSWEDSEIQKYIKSIRHESIDFYDKFEDIYKKSKSYGDAKRLNKNLALWKLRWRLCNCIHHH